ncbi:MAG: carboxylating nicotinate-nucleotide diphosphorylase, partial [Actinomycetota bacterium]|nr:carboxylating nicotinate-nucleotide diphosphorylase [Actinomycetota bacterium]
MTDEELIERALAEDVGDGDATTAATVDPAALARATIVQKAPGVISGLAIAEGVFAWLDPAARFERLGPEGAWREAGAPVLAVEGNARGLLTGERTALNFLGRLSGVATLTARVVDAVRQAGGTAQLLDTRKTTPGLRRLEKAAVAAGGGVNHRAGLYDAILIKENHAALAGGVAEAVRRARDAQPGMAVEVECRDAGEVTQAIEAGADRLLLDNMGSPELRAAVVARDAVTGSRRTELEASGGITLDNVRAMAESGVDWISVGALTHSAPTLDLSLVLR